MTRTGRKVVHNWQFADLLILFSEMSVTLNAACDVLLTYYVPVYCAFNAVINVAEILINLE